MKSVQACEGSESLTQRGSKEGGDQAKTIAETRTVSIAASIPGTSPSTRCQCTDAAPLARFAPVGVAACELLDELDEPPGPPVTCFDPPPPAPEASAGAAPPGDEGDAPAEVDDAPDAEEEFPPDEFRTMPEAGVTCPSSPSALAYALWPSSSVTETMSQPELLMSGKASMNAWTVYCESSCSRTISPGLFGPVIHLVSDALTLCSVVLKPGWPMLQSSVLRCG